MKLAVIYAIPPPSDEYVLSDIEILAGDTGVKTNISDYSSLAPYLWLEGVKEQDSDKYSLDYPPQLLKTNWTEGRVTAGVRPIGLLEKTPFFGYWTMPQYSPKSLENSAFKNIVEPLRRQQDCDVTLFSVDATQARTSSKVSYTSGVASVQARLATRQRLLAENQRVKMDAASIGSRDTEKLSGEASDSDGESGDDEY